MKSDNTTVQIEEGLFVFRGPTVVDVLAEQPFAKLAHMLTVVKARIDTLLVEAQQIEEAQSKKANEA